MWRSKSSSSSRLRRRGQPGASRICSSAQEQRGGPSWKQRRAGLSSTCHSPQTGPNHTTSWCRLHSNMHCNWRLPPLLGTSSQCWRQSSRLQLAMDHPTPSILDRAREQRAQRTLASPLRRNQARWRLLNAALSTPPPTPLLGAAETEAGTPKAQ